MNLVAFPVAFPANSSHGSFCKFEYIVCLWVALAIFQTPLHSWPYLQLWSTPRDLCIFNCPEQLNRWPCHWLTDSIPNLVRYLLNSMVENLSKIHSIRLGILGTCKPHRGTSIFGPFLWPTYSNTLQIFGKNSDLKIFEKFSDSLYSWDLKLYT